MRPIASSSPARRGCGLPPTPAGMVRERLLRGPAVIRLVAAAVATVAFHVGLIVALPAELARPVPEERPRPSLEIVLDPPSEPETPPENFVIPNPDVPTHPPDRSQNFAERDQEAAQEEPAEEEIGTPEVEGEFEEPTQYLVEEEESPPIPFEEWALPGDDFGVPGLPEGRPVERFEPAEEGEGTEVPVAEESEEDDEKLEVALDSNGRAEQGEQSDAGSTEESLRRPQPRPRLSQASGGPVGPRLGGTTRVGTLAVDANFSEFGDYLTRMLEAINRRWHDLAWESLPSAEVGTVVAVSFQIDRNGEVHGLQVDSSTASLTATLICQDAINSRQPYGKWSGEMREVLGEEQTVRIRFHYR